MHYALLHLISRVCQCDRVAESNELLLSRTFTLHSVTGEQGGGGGGENEKKRRGEKERTFGEGKIGGALHLIYLDVLDQSERGEKEMQGDVSRSNAMVSHIRYKVSLSPTFILPLFVVSLVPTRRDPLRGK